jgi:hypothetical protein
MLRQGGQESIAPLPVRTTKLCNVRVKVTCGTQSANDKGGEVIHPSAAVEQPTLGETSDEFGIRS